MGKGKLYTTVKRIGLLIIAVVIGSSLFLLLTLAGKKNRGPLDDLLSAANLNFSRIEKNMLDKNRGTRLDSLQWFFKYRSSKAMFSTLDTILLGAYDDNTVESYGPIIGLEDSLQTKFPIISIYTAWGSKSNEVFPSLRAQAINNLVVTPVPMAHTGS